MKKIAFIYCFLFCFTGSIQASIVSNPGSKYYFEHQPIAAGSNMKAAYGNGVQMIASYKPNSTVVVWLEDTGEAFLLNSKIRCEQQEFSLIPQKDIQLYAIDEKGKRKLVKQYSKEKIYKAFQKEIASGVSVPSYEMPRNKKAVVTYKNNYGQTLGTATVTEQDANPFAGLSGALGNMTTAIRASKQAKNAAAPYAQQYTNMFWDRHTFFPGDTADGKALFQDKKAPSYELVIQLGKEKHTFHFDRLKK